MVAALETALQMEIDGKKFYQKAAETISNGAGKKLFQRLAAEEDIHRLAFEAIFQSIQKKQGWPLVDFHPGGKQLRTIFAEAARSLKPGATAPSDELAAVQIGLDMEEKSYELYQGRAKVTSGAERDFYQLVAAEERQHRLALADYYEYLTAPASFFVKRGASLPGRRLVSVDWLIISLQ